MPRIDMQQLPDDARMWIFGISPPLDSARSARLLQHVDEFLGDWNSGCSIDRMFGTLRRLERELGVSILDANRVFVRHGDGRIDAVPRADFSRSGDRHTIVFDTLAERLGDVRSGRWERHAEDSWHARLLGARV
jgi:hypothetical protein